MFDELKNNIDFFIRSCTKFSRKNFVEKDERMLLRVEMENLYVYDILNNAFEKAHISHAKILDIGSKNWFYASGEYRFFKEFCDEITLHGVELDAYRLYSNFYSRYEVAKFYTRNLKNTNYFAKNLLELVGQYDYIVWILPFVLQEPLCAWGLPKKFFCPDKLLLHAFKLLKEGGQMFIVNQGIVEAQVQRELFESLHIKYKELGRLHSPYFEYQNERFGWVIRK